jgi:hypothetical protein
MSGRQQRVMVQPIVRSSVLFRRNPNPDIPSICRMLFSKIFSKCVANGVTMHPDMF